MARQWRPNSVPREARRRQERPMLPAWYVLPSAQRHDHAPMGTWRIQANPLSRATEDPNQRPQRAPYFLKVYEQLPRKRFNPASPGGFGRPLGSRSVDSGLLPGLLPMCPHVTA